MNCSFELAEVVEPAGTVDKLRIGDGIGRAGKQIGQAHLVPHIGRYHGQCGVKQPGHTFEEIAQEGTFRTMDTRDATSRCQRTHGLYAIACSLADFQLAFHAFVSMTGQWPQTFITVDGKGAGLRRGEFEQGRLAGAHVLLDRQTSRRVFDDEIVRDERRDALERQLDRLAFLDDQMPRLIGIAVEDDGGALHAVGIDGTR